MKKTGIYIPVSALLCIFACIGEFVVMFVFGASYPGYNHLYDTMSALGASVSPVSVEVSFWWVIMGVFMILFGIGFQEAFREKGRIATLASWLIILYGLGEGIGSGLFRADHTLSGLTISAIIHDILGGIGVASILLLPFIMQKVIPKIEKPAFFRMSQIFFITGLFTKLLFLFRYSSDENNFLSLYKGLWQRLFMLNTYIYLTTIAILMIKRK